MTGELHAVALDSCCRRGQRVGSVAILLAAEAAAVQELRLQWTDIMRSLTVRRALDR
jgi:hypothetical protein